MFHTWEMEELQRRIHALEVENVQLKETVFHLWENEIVSKNNVPNIRKIQQETRDKWLFYHSHKDTIINEYCTSHDLKREQLSWVWIKKESDKLWNISLDASKLEVTSNLQRATGLIGLDGADVPG